MPTQTRIGPGLSRIVEATISLQLTSFPKGSRTSGHE
jgi:hypothetical protein